MGDLDKASTFMGVKMPSPWLVALVLSVASLLASRFSMAECRDILEQGIRNTYQTLWASDLRSVLIEKFCNTPTQKTQSSSGGGTSIGFPFDGMPVEVSGNSTQHDADSLRQDLCSGHSRGLSDDEYENLLSAAADPKIVEAWKQCEKNSGKLLLNGKLNGSTLNLSIVMCNSHAVASTIVDGDPIFDGIRCDAPWLDGMKIDGSVRYLQCKRVGTGPVTAIVNTELNRVMFFIPRQRTGPFQIRIPAHAPLALHKSKFVSSKAMWKNRCPAKSAALGSGGSCRTPPNVFAFDNGNVTLESFIRVIGSNCSTTPDQTN